MSKTSRLTLIAALAGAAIAAPTFSQTAAARQAFRHHAAYPHPRLYNYAPGGLYNYAPGPVIVSPFSNHPAATGGGSLGYNVDNLRDN
jgi:hypothetical protein